MQLAQCETAGAPGAPLIRQDYRDAMARLAAAVNIITTDGPSGRAGFTAPADGWAAAGEAEALWSSRAATAATR